MLKIIPSVGCFLKIGILIKRLKPISDTNIGNLEIINAITEKERQDFILGFSETDSKGYYEEFCPAIIYLLKN